MAAPGSWWLWFLLLAGPSAAAAFTQPQDSEFTFLLPAGRQECFYQGVVRNNSMEVEYQVIGGAGLDVDFTLVNPRGEILVAEYRKSDGVHTVEPTEDGDYMMCFDNSFSTISEKLIFFELIFDSQQGEEEADNWSEIVEPEEMLDIKLEDIKEAIETMKLRLERSIQMQTVLRAFEARDRNLQEGNLQRVDFWSAVNVSVLVAVAFLQLYMLKSLFDDKRKVRT
ncbi:transmembrane emp24 domain-containing protein 1 [Rhinatrema bivittatum]|uniref:transmembrane emp24 domain-containing protein 1 n=1 Tax=Rhinatrema bivittatum TaxID=194408 RepID=UPI00112DB6B3|nr:transmembrane emp24 domain-containing protein 1 [Rhinatrema bivittatum]